MGIRKRLCTGLNGLSFPTGVDREKENSTIHSILLFLTFSNRNYSIFPIYNSVAQVAPKLLLFYFKMTNYLITF